MILLSEKSRQGIDSGFKSHGAISSLVNKDNPKSVGLLFTLPDLCQAEKEDVGDGGKGVRKGYWLQLETVVITLTIRPTIFYKNATRKVMFPKGSTSKVNLRLAPLWYIWSQQVDCPGVGNIVAVNPRHSAGICINARSPFSIS